MQGQACGLRAVPALVSCDCPTVLSGRMLATTATRFSSTPIDAFPTLSSQPPDHLLCKPLPNTSRNLPAPRKFPHNRSLAVLGPLQTGLIRVTACPSSDTAVEVTVSDSGVGLSQTTIDAIFSTSEQVWPRGFQAFVRACTFMYPITRINDDSWLD